MYLAKNLRRLRLNKGLTQEELALRVGVSAQAVSKWERDECYPDITLLPGLANCFGVSVDELLGMTQISDSQRLNDAFGRMHELGRQGRYDEIIDMMESMLKIFPNNAGLLSCLAMALALHGDATGRPIQLCEQALEECTSFKQRGTICAALCFLHRRAGAREKAEKLALSLPHARESRELLLPHFLKQPQKDAYLREHLPGILTAICALIGDEETDEEALRSILHGTYRKPVEPAEAIQRIAAFLGDHSMA